jgi:hypothetical protein
VERGDHLIVPMRLYARGEGSGVEVEMEAAYVMKAREGKLVRLQLYADAEEALASVPA